MDNSKLSMYVLKPFLLVALASAAAWRALSLREAFRPQDLDGWFENLSGPFGVLFGELLSIIVLAKVLKTIYQQKEKLQSKLLDDRDRRIEKLEAERDQLLDQLQKMWE